MSTNLFRNAAIGREILEIPLKVVRNKSLRITRFHKSMNDCDEILAPVKPRNEVAFDHPCPSLSISNHETHHQHF